MSYGQGTSSPSVSAKETTAPVAATTSGRYTFAKGMRIVKVQLSPTAAGNLHLRWNAAAAGKTLDAAGQCLWNDILQPGDSVVYPGHAGSAIVHQLGVWIDDAMTYGTDYNIEGWE